MFEEALHRGHVDLERLRGGRPGDRVVRERRAVDAAVDRIAGGQRRDRGRVREVAAAPAHRRAERARGRLVGPAVELRDDVEPVRHGGAHDAVADVAHRAGHQQGHRSPSRAGQRAPRRRARRG
ncbi:MAG: hypothetical protein U1F45_05295 [Burkholderiales bacterium]